MIIAVSLLLTTALLAGCGSTATLEPTVTPEPTATPEPPPIEPRMRDLDGMVEVFVPAGSFSMGSAGRDREAPVHRVTLSAFWMDQTEVTNAMFAAFLNARGNETEGGVTWLDSGDTGARIHQSGSTWQADAGYEDHPVVEVSWYGAQAYCAWVGGSLPTEAQWEYAARGDLDGMNYPWGNESPSCIRENKNGAQYQKCDGFTVSVGSFATNAYGLFDMAGNVWEWVIDWYDAYPGGAQTDPIGPETGDFRVLRGGGWWNEELDLRVSNRSRELPSFTYNGLGFRCAHGTSP